MGVPESVFGGVVFPMRSLILRLNGMRVIKWESGLSLTIRVLRCTFEVRPVVPGRPETVDWPVVDSSSVSVRDPVLVPVPASEGGPLFRWGVGFGVVLGFTSWYRCNGNCGVT